MAINWPTIAQGTGTGTTYTAPLPGKNVWTWNGYSWGSTGSTTVNGGFGGPWVVFDQYGKSRAFATLPKAITLATSGDWINTIHLFQNITEYATSSNYVQLSSYLNINLNGFTYTINANGYGGSMMSNMGSEVIINIYDGKISCINAEPSTSLIVEQDALSPTHGCKWTFQNVTFSKDLGNAPVAEFHSSVTGGIFEDTSAYQTTALNLFSIDKSNVNTIIFKDCIAKSDNGFGIVFGGGGSDLTTLCINCKGYSNAYSESSDISGILVTSSNVTLGNRFRLINCGGFNTAGSGGYASGSYGLSACSGINTLNGNTLINSRGISISGHGIKSFGSRLIHCKGGGGNISVGSSFYSRGRNLFKKCSSIEIGESENNDNKIGIFLEMNTQDTELIDYVDNCSLSSQNTIIATPNTTPSNIINISNSELSYYYRAIYSPIEGLKTNLYNSSIICKFDGYQSTTQPTIMTFGDYSHIINNVFLGPSGPSHTWTIDAEGATARTIYIGNNTTRNYLDLLNIYEGQGSIIQGITSSRDTQGNIQQDI